MHQFIEIFQITGRRDNDFNWRTGTVQQNLSVHALGYPTIQQLLAHVLEFEEELAMREIQMIAGRLVAIPAGHLQQPAEDVYFFFVREHIDGADHSAVHRLRALQLTLLHFIIGSQLLDELIYAGRVLIGDGVRIRLKRGIVEVGFFSGWGG
jgi:hypothetical protein